MSVASLLLLQQEKRKKLQPFEFQTHSRRSVNNCRLIHHDHMIVTCSDDKTIGFWDSVSGNHLQELTGHKHCIKCMDIDEGHTQIITASWDKSAILWNYTTAQKIWATNHESLLTSCCMYSNLQLAVTGCDNNHFYCWDIRSGDMITNSRGKKGHCNTITCCKISSDGFNLCTTSMDRTALIWDLRMMKYLLKLSGHINVVSSCAFSHNNHYVCTSSWDKTVRLFDIHSGSYRSNGAVVFTGHDGSVSGCDFSSDGAMLASCGYDQHVSLWNINSFEHIGGLQGHGTWLQDIHFGEDSKWVITCSKDGIIKLWDTEAANLIYKKKNIGLNMAKCDQCGRLFSFITRPDPSQCLCVFCRLQSPHRSLESLVAPLQ